MMRLGLFYIVALCTLFSYELVESKFKPRTTDKDLSNSPHVFEGEHSAAYDHDAFLGRDEAKRFDDLTPEESKRKLGEIVDKIDLNNDGQITSEEMTAWINKVSKKMLLDDVDRAWKDFELQDGDKLSWEKHIDELFGEDGDLEDEDDETKKAYSEKDKRRWIVADADGDGKLSKLEYLAFLHPEHEPKMRDVVIKETMEEVDKNNDSFVDLDEYIRWETQQKRNINSL
ncbi:EF hand containing protein [Schistosoma mansoni]|uniref:EF hand containing protein n=1 Tax=Schistosoma mansoni TaxID=6183 RepID=UPI0001A633D7|nr:EF hand containing protein [Schistosoma mansoni]|eukprot:XP_018648565.1 EF hand containing protein [Schistosoma mansoni]